MKKNFILKFSLLALILTTPTMSNAGSATATFNLTNIIRAAVGMAMGYNDTTAYNALVCGSSAKDSNGDCQGPPHNGIVGAAVTIVNEINTINQNAGLACSAMPSSGTATRTDFSGSAITLKYETPTHTIPSLWSRGGETFQKRITFTKNLVGEPAKFAYEFNCGDSAANYIAINMDIGSVPGYKRLITLYTGKISNYQNGIELYMSEYNSSIPASRAVDAIRIEFMGGY